MARYDGIGRGYATRRREDPDLRLRIESVLGDARTVVNVGAGTGSYEPTARQVIAVEPSEVMAKQRASDRPAVRGTAQALPLHDRSVDAAMTVLSLHHWHPDQRAGIEEMCRVARDVVVVVTFDAAVAARMWLIDEYFPEVGALDRKIMTDPETIAGWMDRPTTIEVVEQHRDTPDHNMMAFWAHPERVFDPVARSATSGFARMPGEVVERVIRELRADLDSGAWDKRHADLRTRAKLDVGLRMIVAR